MLRLIIRLIPAPLHRLLLNLMHRARVVWWRTAGREPDDCRVVALDEAGRVLLVRHSYGSGDWMLPGGGPKRGEKPVAAGQRELAEETGCALHDARELAKPAAGAGKRRFAVVGHARGAIRIDGREIVEARFFALDALPERVGPALHARLAELISAYHATE